MIQFEDYLVSHADRNGLCSAISLHGLDAIASGLAAALEELPAVRTVHQDLEERLLAMAKILEALQRAP